MPRLSQKPGFLDCARGFRNRVSHPNLGILTKIIAETRFLGLCAGAQKPGFFPKSWYLHQNYRRNPVSWIVRGGSETGFLPKSWWGCRDCRRNPVSWTLG
ncbi:MAG: hypothetical protein EAZ39_11485 [Oscillatoriales cyanobacterium]|nr:MAG: hypothetical protein EAZ39_11485 [Oscillatoriales cyanobacterium]